MIGGVVPHLKLPILKNHYGRDHAKLIQKQQRDGHDNLAENIRRRDDGADNENNDDRMTPFLHQKRGSSNADLRQEGHNQRHFENNAEGQQRRSNEGYVVINGDHGNHAAGGKTQQEVHGEGNGNQIAEGDAGHEQRERKKSEHPDIFFLLILEADLDKFPYLIKKHRGCSHQTQNQRQLQARDKRIGRRRENHVTDGLQKIFKKKINEGITDDTRDGQGGRAHKQPAPEFIQMIEE